MALKLKTDRNPVIWMNTKALSKITRIMTDNGVSTKVKPEHMGVNYPDAGQLQNALNIIASELHGKFKGSEHDYGFLKAFKEQVDEAMQYSKTGSLLAVNVDSPHRQVRILPSAYEAIKGLVKGKSKKDTGTISDLIRTFRHEGVHSELSTIIKNIPSEESKNIMNDPSVKKIASALFRKGGYDPNSPYIVINEFMAHFLSGDKEFFKASELTGEDLVKTYASIRKYLLAIDEAAIGRAERFRKPGIKTSE